MVSALRKTRLPEKRCNKEQARQHSALVKSLRLILPVFIAGIGSTYVVMATPQTVDQSFPQQFANLDEPTEELRMEQPRFVGEDAAGRAFKVLANAAQQNPDMPDLVSLDNPEAFRDADAEMGDEYVKALEGLYSVKNKTVDLRNNVQIRQSIGADSFILNTENGKIAFDDRTFSSDVKVFGESSQGTISADGMTAYQDEDKVVFRNAHMRYNVGKDAEEAGGVEDGGDASGAEDAEKENGTDPET